MWNQDEIEGKAKQAKGTVKDKLGDWTDNPTLEQEGEAEHFEGKVQENAGKAKRKVREIADDIKHKFTDD